jgi:hypothetical protein
MSKLKWVTIEAGLLGVHELTLCAQHLARPTADGYGLLDGLRCMHLAMIGVLTQALSGSVGTGALTAKSARAAKQAIVDKSGVAFVERSIHFSDLLQRAQVPGNLEWAVSPLVLSLEEAAACAILDGDRGLIDHPKPTTWSLNCDEIRDCLATVAPIVRRLMNAVPQHFDAKHFTAADAAVAGICADHS